MGLYGMWSLRPEGDGGKEQAGDSQLDANYRIIQSRNLLIRSVFALKAGFSEPTTRGACVVSRCKGSRA